MKLNNYNFQDIEQEVCKAWSEKKIYLWNQQESRANTFVVDTPPPTVSGQLHIGHVYSYTQTDFIVRYQRMKGKNICYPMGFDDNGLPTERLVEKQRKIKASATERSEFVKICKEVILEEESKFKNLFQQIALSVDWNLQYQTISEHSQKISQMSFLDLLSKGAIYRAKQPILWDPVDQTALSQTDVEEKEVQSYFNEIEFTTQSGAKLTIATTRPELLGACVALLYHPEDERYKHLYGQYAITPIFQATVPIIHDDAVIADKGTGLVMCCTFGDMLDVNWWRKHNLDTKITIDKRGYVNDDVIKNLKILDARAQILSILKDNSLLKSQKEVLQTVKCAERSGAPLEIIITDQWFIKTVAHKDAILQKIQELKWHPESMKIKLETWVHSINYDWCISRQRYFGVPFPVWYSKRQGEEGKIIYASQDQLPVDPTTHIPHGYLREEIEPETDVMDTWATSAVSPNLVSHAISNEFAIDINRHKQLFPFDLRPQAHEILRTWAFYTILKSHLHEQTLPWRNIMISGWCLAEDRSKMSKSKGNTILPDVLLSKYGADAVRYWSANSKLGADITYSEDVLQNGKRLTTKLWNASKFASQHFGILKTEHKNSNITDLKSLICCSFDIWIIEKMQKLLSSAEALMENYEYSSCMHQLEKFLWSDFCDIYIEVVKTRSYNDDDTNIQWRYSAILTTYHILQNLLKLFAPFIPYITDKIYNTLYLDEENANLVSIHSRGMWPSQIKGFEAPATSTQNVEFCIDVIHTVRKEKTAHNLSMKAEIQSISLNHTELPKDLIYDLQNVTNAKTVLFDQCATDVNILFE